MGEPGAQAGQPATEGHQDAQSGSGNSKRCARAELHICASCRRVLLLLAAPKCADSHFVIWWQMDGSLGPVRAALLQGVERVRIVRGSKRILRM